MLCDPTEFMEAGVPDGSPLSSLKQHCFSKGTFETGSQNVGFVAVQPWLGSVTGSCGTYSLNGYPGNTITSTTAAGQVASLGTNSMFATGDIGPSPLAQYRLISACLRVRYTGTELNKGGTIHALQHPEHESIDGITIPGIDLYRQAGRFQVSREWTTVNYIPTNSGTVYYETFAGVPANMFMGIMVESPQNNTFDYEFYGNYEYAGRNMRGQTPPNLDPIAYSTAREVLGQRPWGTFQRPSSSFVKEMESLLGSALVAGTTYVVGKGAAWAAQAGAKAINSYMST